MSLSLLHSREGGTQNFLVSTGSVQQHQLSHRAEAASRGREKQGLTRNVPHSIPEQIWPGERDGGHTIDKLTADSRVQNQHSRGPEKDVRTGLDGKW